MVEHTPVDTSSRSHLLSTPLYNFRRSLCIPEKSVVNADAAVDGPPVVVVLTGPIGSHLATPAVTAVAPTYVTSIVGIPSSALAMAGERRLEPGRCSRRRHGQAQLRPDIVYQVVRRVCTSGGGARWQPVRHTQLWQTSLASCTGAPPHRIPTPHLAPPSSCTGPTAMRPRSRAVVSLRLHEIFLLVLRLLVKALKILVTTESVSLSRSCSSSSPPTLPRPGRSRLYWKGSSGAALIWKGRRWEIDVC
uniref:Uncharacterized protein n=1 Tax=Arundo donax TaxID=35708 RepID=A0A0A9E4N0_ARUDO